VDCHFRGGSEADFARQHAVIAHSRADDKVGLRGRIPDRQAHRRRIHQCTVAHVQIQQTESAHGYQANRVGGRRTCGRTPNDAELMLAVTAVTEYKGFTDAW
jgi:hypothetical protein